MKGFDLICPSCGEPDTMRLCLDDCNTLGCSSCDAEIVLTNVRQLVAGWTKFLAWIDQAPEKGT